MGDFVEKIEDVISTAHYLTNNCKYGHQTGLFAQILFSFSISSTKQLSSVSNLYTYSLCKATALFVFRQTFIAA